MLTATTDMRQTAAAAVTGTTELSYDFPIWAGSDQTVSFRIVNDAPEPVVVNLHAAGEHADRLTFSRRRSNEFGATLTLTARAEGMTDTVWLKITIPNDAATELVTSTIFANDSAITLDYQAAGTWDMREDPYPKYAGPITSDMIELFDRKGQVFTLHQYDPITDKTTLDPDSPLITVRGLTKIDRWVDPEDPEFWRGPDEYGANTIRRKLFVGGHNLDLPYPVSWPDQEMTYGDTFRVLLPPDLYPHRIYQPWGEVTPGGPVLSQRTVYALLLNGLRYSLENVKARWAQSGELAFYSADARLIFAPSDNLTQGWWPWSALYEDGRDEIRHYIASLPASARSWSLGYVPSGGGA
jgi:hypothetical protein